MELAAKKDVATKTNYPWEFLDTKGGDNMIKEMGLAILAGGGQNLAVKIGAAKNGACGKEGCCNKD